MGLSKEIKKCEFFHSKKRYALRVEKRKKLLWVKKVHPRERGS